MTTRTYLAAAALFLAPLTGAAQTTEWPASVVCSLGDVTVCTPAGLSRGLARHSGPSPPDRLDLRKA